MVNHSCNKAYRKRMVKYATLNVRNCTCMQAKEKVISIEMSD